MRHVIDGSEVNAMVILTLKYVVSIVGSFDLFSDECLQSWGFYVLFKIKIPFRVMACTGRI